MSFQAMAWASKQKFPAAKKCLLYTLANYCGMNGQLWPSYKTLAEDSGLSRRSVMKYMAEFEANGIIKKVLRKKESGESDSNLWEIVAISGGECGSPRGEGDSLPSEGDSPQVVNEVHQGGERGAPKPIKEPISKSVTEPKRMKSSLTTFPSDFEITPKMREWAKSNASWVNLERETAQLQDWALSKGETKADWVATWRNWMRRSQERLEQSPGVSRLPSQENRPYRKPFPGVTHPTGTDPS